ncbi:MAG: penicillin-binding transpeptidase domain-containing protein [Polyangiales bacterium]
MMRAPLHRPPKLDVSRWMRLRMALLVLLLWAGASVVLMRAFQVQVRRRVEFREMAKAQHVRELQLAPMRGTLFDRHGAELAVSVGADSVWANPRELQRQGGQVQQVVAALDHLLDVDPVRLSRRLRSQRYFVWIKRRVLPKQAEAIRALKLPGVHITEEARRYYPQRELAAHLLGFADIDGKGIEGLELSFETQLRGRSERLPALYDRRGTVVFSEHLLGEQDTEGHDIVLSIDKTLQHIAERELALAARTFEAKAGMVVVVEPDTGDLLAIANYPTFNPNEPGKSPAAHRRNRAVTDRFEPGSTVKPFTIAAALAAGTIRPRQRIDCENGSMEVADVTIHDAHPFDRLNIRDILAFSSNIGTAKIGASLGRRRLYRALRRFGFGHPTGVPLPGETGGILRHYRKWYEVDAATIAFGQGLSVTTLQLAYALAALANEGRLMRPRLVHAVRRQDGTALQRTVPEERRQVVAPAVARTLARMMVAATGPEATGAQAALPDFSVAGKTGTAQKADERASGYAQDKWLASFIGFVPAKRPRLVIAVTLDEPVIAHYGGSVAAPVYRRIAAASLRHLGVRAQGRDLAALGRMLRRKAPFRRTQTGASPAAATRAGRAPTDDSVPDVRGLSARRAAVLLHQRGLVPVLKGSGRVIWQDPAGGDAPPLDGRVRMQLSMRAVAAPARASLPGARSPSLPSPVPSVPSASPSSPAQLWRMATRLSTLGQRKEAP